MLFASIGLIGLAISGIFLLINRSRLRQQMKELELRNQIAADLHDEVGSSLSSIHMLSQIANKTGSTINDVTHMTIWGNHSATQYPDLHETKVNGQAAIDMVDQSWYKDDFIPTVQQRGAAIINARGASSAASAANAAIAHMRSWALGTAEGDWVSMGVYSDGSYGIAEGLIYSFPCVCKDGDWEIVQGLEINDFSRAKMQATELELSEERDAVKHLLP